MIIQWNERGVEDFTVAELLSMDVDATLSPENPSARQFAGDAFQRLVNVRGPDFDQNKMTKRRYDRLTEQMKKFYLVCNPEKAAKAK